MPRQSSVSSSGLAAQQSITSANLSDPELHALVAAANHHQGFLAQHDFAFEGGRQEQLKMIIDRLLELHFIEIVAGKGSDDITYKLTFRGSIAAQNGRFPSNPPLTTVERIKRGARV